MWGTRFRPSASLVRLGIGSIVLVAIGCTSIESYSVRAAEESCAALSVCTVYGPTGEHLSPCTQVGKMTIYPGDPRWPYTTPGVCDAVRNGQVVSTRSDLATPAPNAR
jgi:hypothetical protein